MTGSASGISLKAGASAAELTVTQGNITAQPGNAWVATTSYVRSSGQYWNGSKKFVSNAAPGAGDGVDGDFWFQYAT
jgi:hypothetical protein